MNKWIMLLFVCILGACIWTLNTLKHSLIRNGYESCKSEQLIYNNKVIEGARKNNSETQNLSDVNVDNSLRDLGIMRATTDR